MELKIRSKLNSELIELNQNVELNGLSCNYNVISGNQKKSGEGEEPKKKEEEEEEGDSWLACISSRQIKHFISFTM